MYASYIPFFLHRFPCANHVRREPDTCTLKLRSGLEKSEGGGEQEKSRCHSFFSEKILKINKGEKASVDRRREKIS